MKLKQDKKLLDKEIENQMDREFQKYGAYTHVYHFREVPPFNAITVVTAMPFHWEDLANILSSEEYQQRKRDEA